MKGIYTNSSESSFREDNDVKRNLYLNAQFPEPARETPPPIEKSFNDWDNIFRHRQAEFQETDERVQHVEISFPTTTLISFIGDIHAGSKDTDYARVRQEIETIVNTNNSYLCLMGDVIDGFFFNGAQMEELAQVPEQTQYMRALLKYLGDNKKLLIGWGGDHDRDWQMKQGMNPYTELWRQAGAYYMHGVGYLTANVGEQTYKITGTHRTLGASIYNNAHGAMRLGRDSVGSDVVVVAHNHRKGIDVQAVTEYGGESRPVVFAAVGTYKSGDDYSRKLGFSEYDQDSGSMYGISVLFDDSSKTMRPYMDILEAHNDLIQFQS